MGKGFACALRRNTALERPPGAIRAPLVSRLHLRAVRVAQPAPRRSDSQRGSLGWLWRLAKYVAGRGNRKFALRAFPEFAGGAAPFPYSWPPPPDYRRTVFRSRGRAEGKKEQPLCC